MKVVRILQKKEHLLKYVVCVVYLFSLTCFGEGRRWCFRMVLGGVARAGRFYVNVECLCLKLLRWNVVNGLKYLFTILHQTFLHRRVCVHAIIMKKQTPSLPSLEISSIIENL